MTTPGPVDGIATVCFVGAGTMGSVNALVAAVAGYRAVIYDLDEATLDQVPERQRGFADYMVATGFCTEAEAEAAFGRIDTTTDPRVAAEHADLVSESVVERLAVKRDVHAQFDRLCPPHTILTTNTSSLLVSEIEDAVDRGGRFAALHSHLGSPLVDIVPGPRTSPETVEVLRRYTLSLGGIPLMLRREHPGYVVNALLGPFLTCAAQLVIRGTADVENVDRSWVADQAAALGPFALIDLFGLDVVLDNWRHSSTGETADRRARRAEAIPVLEQFVDQGHLGTKTGRGFYGYPDPLFQRADFAEHAESSPARHLLAAITIRAAQIAADDVADPHDIDRAWIAATSLRAGPFGLIDELGAAGFADLCAAQVAADLVSDDEARQAIDFVGDRAGTFYSYPDPAYERPEFLRTGDGDQQ